MTKSKISYAACLVSIIFYLFQISYSASYPFEETSHQPNLEFSLKGGNQRTLGRAGAIMPLQGSEGKLWFMQLWGLWDNNGAKEWNIGLGYRQQVTNKIVGAYGFFDRRLSTSNRYHSQLTFGAELLGKNLETRVNGYIPTTGAKMINSGAVNKANRVSLVLVDMLEKPLGGVDVEVGGSLTSCKMLQGFLTYYHFNGSGVKAIDGIRFRAQLSLTNYAALTGETSYDRLRKQHWFAGMQFSFNLGLPKKRSDLFSKMTQMVIRDIDVMTDYYSDKNKELYDIQLPQDDLAIFKKEALKELELTINDTFVSYGYFQSTAHHLVSKETKFIEIKQFTASSSIRDKIQSIVIFSAKEISLRLKQLNSSKPIISQLITVPFYDIQGIPSCKSLEDLSCFAAQSYWRIYSIGQNYGIKAYIRGLGGMGNDKKKTSLLSLCSDFSGYIQSQPSSSSSHNSNPICSVQAASVTKVSYTTEDSLMLDHSGNSPTNGSPAIPKSSSQISSKFTALGIRPAINPKFIARQNTAGNDVLAMLKYRFDQPSSPIIEVITGLMGLGKTELAVEYIEQTRASYDGIFWIQANQRNYQPFIEALEIDLKEIAPDALVPTIHQKLMSRGYKRVLWVYDDVPNAEIFNKELFNAVIKNIWCQSNTKVDVLITSRYLTHRRQWAPIKMELFSIDNTWAYIESFFNQNQYPFPKPSREEVNQLNRLLGGVPLAVAQAIHYLKNQKGNISIVQYIKMYKEHLNQKAQLNYFIDGCEQVVWATWNITRKQLSEEANLLLQMSCFLSNNISRSLFEPLWGDKVDDFAKELADYSLIKFNSDFKSFSIHTLSQKVLQLKQNKKSLVPVLLQKILQLKRYKESVALKEVSSLIECAEQLFNKYNANTWSRARAWLPHLTTILPWIEDKSVKARILYNYSRVAVFFGDYFLARNYLKQALSLQAYYYTADILTLINTLYTLSNIEIALSNYEEAQSYGNKTLMLQLYHYGEAHIQLIDTLDNLGFSAYNLGKYKKAKSYYSQALELKIYHYGEKHIEATNTFIGLGAVYQKLGNYYKAKNYATKALELQNLHYAFEHINLSDAYNLLGCVHLDEYSFQKALSYYQAALKIREAYYKTEHIELVESLVGLGDVYLNQHNINQTLTYYHRALSIQKAYYNCDHIKMLNILKKLVTLYQRLNKLNEAKTYLEQIQAIEE